MAGEGERVAVARRDRRDDLDIRAFLAHVLGSTVAVVAAVSSRSVAVARS